MYDTSGWGASDGGAIGSPGTVKKKEKEKKLAALTGVSHYHPLLGESRETMLQRPLTHVNKSAAEVEGAPSHLEEHTFGGRVHHQAPLHDELLACSPKQEPVSDRECEPGPAGTNLLQEVRLSG